jgi:peroxiredoxin Q/BCP
LSELVWKSKKRQSTATEAQNHPGRPVCRGDRKGASEPLKRDAMRNRFHTASQKEVCREGERRLFEGGVAWYVGLMPSRVPKIGDVAPAFDLPAADGSDVELAHYQGRLNVVLLFYPADFSWVCTRQMCAFRDANRELGRLEAVVLGISRNDLEAHERFQRKHKLPFKLLTDDSGHVCRRYGVLGMFGRPRRATFVIDTKGIVRYADVRSALRLPALGEVAATLTRIRSDGTTDDGDAAP